MYQILRIDPEKKRNRWVSKFLINLSPDNYCKFSTLTEAQSKLKDLYHLLQHLPVNISLTYNDNDLSVSSSTGVMYFRFTIINE